MDEWSESSIESDLGMWFPISSLYLAFNDFAFFKHSFYRKRRLLKRVPYLFIFVIRENEIFFDSLFFLFMNRARLPLYDPLQRAKTCHKAIYRSYSSRPSDSDAKYYFTKFGHVQNTKFRVFGFKSDTAVLTFTFRKFSPLLLFRFLDSYFFLLLGI